MGFLGMVGVSAMIKSVDKMVTQYDEKLQQAVLAAAMIVRNDASVKAPYLSGNLSSSLDVDKPEKRGAGEGGGYEVRVGTNVEYAAIQEFGGTTPTGGVIRERKYLRGALEENQEKCQEEIRRVMKGD